jgi:predicted protein tyrosine phosphatase
MNAIRKRLVICGEHELDAFRHRGITHIISVRNPGQVDSTPNWFRGDRLDLQFGDVVSEADAAQLGTLAPTLDDVRRALDFFGRAWSAGSTVILVHCNYGASRSPALAYVGLAHQLGPGQEEASLQAILAIRPEAIPNRLVVERAEAILDRGGALMAALKEHYARINAEMSQRPNQTVVDNRLPAPSRNDPLHYNP